MLYEIAALKVRPRDANKAMEGLVSYSSSPETRATFLGCWEVDVGELGQLYVLRSFETAQDLAAERRSLLSSHDPFATGGVLNGLALESYQPFSFMPPVQPGEYGAVYEFRDYTLAVGGLEPSLAAWEKALPARQPISPVLIAMHSIEGPARLMHIVPYQSFEARLSLRKTLYRQGLWPPVGAPQQIAKATSTIALPTKISKLR